MAPSTNPFSSEEPSPGISGSVGRYRILGRLGEGGMGTVFKALDPDLGRPVAVKIPHFEGHGAAREAAVGRFLREARAAAQVRHPHVCPIHDVGVQDGMPFAVMALIEGTNLGEKIQGGGQPEIPEAVELIAKVAEGLEAAHVLGIVHRDVKPGNILLDESGEPYLTDFGLAWAPPSSDGGTRITRTGAIVGTPAYMAPEQARGDTERIGPWTDVYGLGMVLYQMVTGSLPYRGTVGRILESILLGEPLRPSRVRPDLDPALDEIIARALDPRPEGRYRSGGGFAHALRKWRKEHNTGSAPTLPYTEAKAAPAGERRGSWPRRIAATCVALAVLSAGVWFLARPSGPEGSKAEDDPSGPTARKKTDASGVGKAASLIRCEGHRAAVNCIAFFPDGRSVFSGGGDFQAGVGKALVSRDPVVIRWDTATGKEMQRYSYPQPVRCLALSPDGATLLVGCDPPPIPVMGKVHGSGLDLREIAGGKDLLNLPVVGGGGFVFAPTGCAFSPDGRHVLLDLGNGGVRKIHRESGQETAVLPPLYKHSYDHHRHEIHVAYAPDGRRILCGGGDIGLKLRDGLTGKDLTIFDWPTGKVRCVALSPDGSRAVSGSQDHLVRLWDVATGKLLRCWKGHSGPVRCVAFSPKAQQVLSGGEDRAVILWEVDRDEDVRRFGGHADAVTCVAFSPGGRQAATGSRDGTVHIRSLVLSP